MIRIQCCCFWSITLICSDGKTSIVSRTHGCESLEVILFEVEMLLLVFVSLILIDVSHVVDHMRKRADLVRMIIIVLHHVLFLNTILDQIDALNCKFGLLYLLLQFSDFLLQGNSFQFDTSRLSEFASPLDDCCELIQIRIF